MYLFSVLCFLLVTTSFATTQYNNTDDKNQTVQDADGSLHSRDEMVTITRPESPIERIPQGHHTFWTLLVPPEDYMQIVVDEASNAGKASLWIRFKYDDKDIVLFVDDIGKDTIIERSDRLNLKSTWRARSLSNGLVMFDDQGLQASVSFTSGDEQLRPRRDIEIYLGGADMWREGYIEAKRTKDFADQEAGSQVKEIKELWEGMERDPNKADMELVKRHHGSIVPPRHGAEL